MVIYSPHYAGMYLTSDGSNVFLKKYTGEDGQIWHFSQSTDGSYRLESFLNGKCMDISATDNGTNVHIYSDNLVDSQRWCFYNSGKYFTIKSKVINRVLDISGYGHDYDNIQIWNANQNNNQIFAVEKLVMNTTIPQFRNQKSVYDKQDSVTLQWTRPAFTKTFTLDIERLQDSSFASYSSKQINANQYSIADLPIGYYRAKVTSNKGYETKNSYYTYFNVIDLHDFNDIVPIAQNEKYVVFDEHLTFDAAQTLCEAMGGKLAEIHTSEENSIIYNLVQNSSCDYFWIGGTDKNEEGKWCWQAGKQFWNGNSNGNTVNNMYVNWNANEPNAQPDEHYLCFYKSSGKWDDVPYNAANSSIGFICQFDTYNVTFDTTGGNANTKYKTVRYNSVYGELPTPTRKGYKFKGWYTALEGGTQIIDDTKVAITNSQTLYAQWEKLAPYIESLVTKEVQIVM